jgi:hypothetical protein
MPPTTSRYMLEEWSACFGWQERLRREQAGAETARRAEMIRQTEALAREQALLMSTVGTGALTLVGQVLRTVVDPVTGALRQRVPVSALPGLMRAGAELSWTRPMRRPAAVSSMGCGQPWSGRGAPDRTTRNETSWP